MADDDFDIGFDIDIDFDDEGVEDEIDDTEEVEEGEEEEEEDEEDKKELDDNEEIEDDFDDNEPDEELIKGIASSLDAHNDVSEFQKIINHRQKMANSPLEPPRILTKYELTGIIGYRAQQIAEGATPYVKVEKGMDAIAIAIAEFDQNLIPFIIERPYPANKIGKFKYEKLKLDELINFNTH